MTGPVSPTPHRRTRADHASEIAEDYCEAIAQIDVEGRGCRVTDLAGRFGVSHVTVVRTIKRLERDGLVRTEPRRPIHLTTSGRRLAARCRERHEIVQRFLVALGVDPRVASVDAEGIEHHVSPSTLARFRAFLEREDGRKPPS